LNSLLVARSVTVMPKPYLSGAAKRKARQERATTAAKIPIFLRKRRHANEHFRTVWFGLSQTFVSIVGLIV